MPLSTHVLVVRFIFFKYLPQRIENIQFLYDEPIKSTLNEKRDLQNFAPRKYIAKMGNLSSKSGAKMVIKCHICNDMNLHGVVRRQMYHLPCIFPPADLPLSLHILAICLSRANQCANPFIRPCTSRRIPVHLRASTKNFPSG